MKLFDLFSPFQERRDLISFTFLNSDVCAVMEPRSWNKRSRQTCELLADRINSQEIQKVKELFGRWTLCLKAAARPGLETDQEKQVRAIAGVLKVLSEWRCTDMSVFLYTQMSL